MAGSKSIYLSGAFLNHALGVAAFDFLPQGYLALFTAATGLDANEPSAEALGGAYARQSVDFEAAVAGATQNSEDVNFPVATAGWGVLTHWAVMDAAVEGNVLYWGELDQSYAVPEGSGFRVQAGELNISET